MSRHRVTALAKVASLAATLAAVGAVAPACSQGQGNGVVIGTLNVPDCWTGAFEMHADFLAGIPYRESFDIRIQNGSDFETFSDGLSILVQDITKIRPDPAHGSAGRYGQALEVSLPAGVSPPGVPISPDATPAPVNMTLYLQKSCRVQNVTLHAVEQVTIPADGTCDAPAVQGADPNAGCAPDTELAAGVGSGRSLVTFTHIFDGRVDEPIAAERLTEGCFDVYLADPGEVAAGGLGPPPLCRGHLRGTFSFFFERGRPSQPFP